MNLNGQVTLGYGTSGAASFNQSKLNADYASVQQQSGLFAGDGGYQIDIGNHTDLEVKISEINVNQLTAPKTKEDAELLARIYVHGIMNTSDQDRTTGAIQYGGKEYLENDSLIVRKRYSSLPAEFVYTVFERLRAGLDIPSILGASSTKNALNWANYEEMSFKDTTLNAYVEGTSYPITNNTLGLDYQADYMIKAIPKQ